jgi:membrane protein implicated in regulation of membrane protease activity
VIAVRVLVFGNAPPWAACVLWLALTVAIVQLWRAIRRQADRERHRRSRRLDNHDSRLCAIEDYLGFVEPPEEEDQWPNPAPNR